MRSASRVGAVFLFLPALAAMGWAGPLRAQSPDQGRPNILMIAVDDLNDWVGVMGGHPNAMTPNIDRLAERGTLFTNAHTAAPLCGPSRAAVLSGLRPSTTGIHGNYTTEKLLSNRYIKRTTLLPIWLAEHGYKTMGTGKISHRGASEQMFQQSTGGRSFGPKPKERMAYRPDPPRTSTDWGAFPERDGQMPDHGYAGWAIEQLGKEHGKPFFLAVGFVRPHVPWHVPRKWFDMHPLEDVQVPFSKPGDLRDVPEVARRMTDLKMMPSMQWMKKKDRWAKSVQAYLACTTFMDAQVGRVLDALETARTRGTRS